MPNNNASSFELLKTKNIYAILDGDADFYSSILDETVSMPYQTGQDLVSTLNTFGNSREYDKSSRWEYVEELLDYCITANRVSELLAYLFNIKQFRDSLKGKPAEEIKKQHEAIVAAAIDAINGELYFSGHKLKQSGNTFIITSINKATAMKAPAVKAINQAYIKDIAERAHCDIEQGNYDSALTKARTLLEEVFCNVIERKGAKPANNGNIGKLFSEAKEFYRMHTNEDTDKRICNLINGLNKIVDSIGDMRNNQSDAHGVGANRISIEDYHARLAVNAAVNVADFMLAVANNAETNIHKTAAY